MKSINIFSLIHFPRQHLRTTGQGYEVKHTLYFFLRCSHLLEICFFLNPIFWMITLLGNMTGKLEACINRSTAWCRLHECIMSPCTSNFCLCKYDMSLNWIPLWPPYAHDHDFCLYETFHAVCTSTLSTPALCCAFFCCCVEMTSYTWCFSICILWEECLHCCFSACYSLVLLCVVVCWCVLSSVLCNSNVLSQMAIINYYYYLHSFAKTLESNMLKFWWSNWNY